MKSAPCLSSPKTPMRGKIVLFLGKRRLVMSFQRGRCKCVVLLSMSTPWLEKLIISVAFLQLSWLRLGERICKAMAADVALIPVSLLLLILCCKSNSQQEGSGRMSQGQEVLTLTGMKAREMLWEGSETHWLIPGPQLRSPWSSSLWRVITVPCSLPCVSPTGWLQ